LSFLYRLPPFLIEIDLIGNVGLRREDRHREDRLRKDWIEIDLIGNVGLRLDGGVTTLQSGESIEIDLIGNVGLRLAVSVGSR